MNDEYVMRLAYTQNRELAERVESLYITVTASTQGSKNGPPTARLVERFGL